MCLWGKDNTSSPDSAFHNLLQYTTIMIKAKKAYVVPSAVVVFGIVSSIGDIPMGNTISLQTTDFEKRKLTQKSLQHQ